MTFEQEIAAIKTEHFSALAKREVILIVRHDYGYQVEHWLPDGMAPTSSYDTPCEAAARALQLMGIKAPIHPQDRPEVAQIGGGDGHPPRP